MFPFRTWPRARLLCRADFTIDSVLNIDFQVPGAELVPFHLSLRAAEGVAVVNRRHADGWRREIVFPFAPGPEPVAVEVGFALGRAWVALDGRILGRFDALPRPARGGRLGLRHGFPGLNRIGSVVLKGALEPESLRLTGQDAGKRHAAPHLSDALELCWDEDDSGERVTLTASGIEAPIPVQRRLGPLAAPDGTPHARLVALIPGRVWLGGAPQVELSLSGVPALTLTRAELVQHLARVAASGIWDDDGLAVLQTVEHVRHAGLWPELASDVQAALAGAARRLRVDAWLLAGTGAPPPVPAQGMAADDDARLLRERIGALLVQGDVAQASGLAAEGLGNGAIDRQRRQIMARELVEGFLAAGALPDLVRMTDQAGLLPLDEANDAWSLTTALPFDLAQGWFGAVAERLRWLARGVPGWPVLPAVGWAISQLMRLEPSGAGRQPSPLQMDEAVTAFAGLLTALTKDPMGRAPCVWMMAAGRDVLKRADLLGEAAARAAREAIVGAWGLAPAFWAGFDGGIPERLRPAADLCTRVQRLVLWPDPDPAQIDAALTAAAAMGMAEATRYRREMLGSPGHPPRTAGAEGAEASLRALLHPEGPATPDAAALRAGTAGLRAAYWRVPAAWRPEAERGLLQQARRLLDRPDPAELADFARAARHLAAPEARSAGLSLALGLAAGLARQGGPAAAALEPLLRDPPGNAPGTDGPDLALAVLARHDAELAARAAAALGRPATATAPADPLSHNADPLFDTLVAVYSCRPYLASRLPHLRATWLADLDAAGIPWLVFTGNGDGRRDGNVVALDAPDDYEGLPDKTLAMVRWVLANTGFSRLLKVDDDCFVHTPAMFGDLAMLRHRYLGRALTLVPGQMDRAWHMTKSSSPRGRLELDKSPERAAYADGGSGYVLSRGAMAALVSAADSPQGRRLRQVSFMEDKLVGDLLALRRVPVSGEDWRVGVWRRPGPVRAPLPAWENGVLPFQGSPVRLVHLDDAGAMADAQAAARAPAPRRGKVWPTFHAARLGNESNALDLLSPPERLARARNAPVAVVACLRDEAAILPAFLNHYRRLGVGGFLIVDNGSTDGTVELLEQAPDVALFHADTEYRHSHYGVAWQQALLAQFRFGRWSLVADADEFLILPDDVLSLPALLDTPAMRDADAARILMLDLYPKGPLSGATLRSGDPFAETGWADRAPFLRQSPARGPFGDAETVTSGLRHRLIPGSRPELFVAQKMALLRYRPWMRFSAGLHYASGVRAAPGDLIFAHFKYTAAFRAKAEAEARRGQHFNDAEEYRRYLALLAEGRETIWDADVSVPWRAVPEVQRILAG